MTHIFLPPDQIASDQIIITGDQARHLALVLRSKLGDTVTVFDGNGCKYECRLTVVHKKEVQAEIIDKSPYSAESPVSITLAQGLPKGDKMDLIVQKSTELGVNTIIPLITERSQVRHTGKVERWRKIALSASQQSGRDKVPEIEEPAAFDNYLSKLFSPAARGYIEDIKGVKLDSGTCIILSEVYKTRNLKQVLTSANDASRITILVGPEGGFSKEEVSAAIEKGFIEVSLGPRILRTETSPLAAISIIQYELGDLGQ
jgi:16S rRNA (uracil1498-N3)-methyltransferase